MKKIHFLIALVCFVYSFAFNAQINLVPNHSFELLDSCPSDLNEIVCSKYWEATHASPDLFANCYNGFSDFAKTPKNSLGYKCPSNGLNYSGFISYFTLNNTTYQEILGAKLIDSLVIGNKYYLSFKIALAGGNGNTYANSKNGIKLTTKHLPFTSAASTSTDNIINNFAHFFSSQTITDTSNWTTLKGSLVADSNYKYIYFGNFFEYSNTTPSLLYGSSSFAYYYLDDVCISSDSLTCNINSQIICLTTKLNEYTLDKKIYISPNPCSNIFYVMGVSGTYKYSIINSFGKIIKSETEAEHQEIDTSEIISGLYFIQIEYNNNLYKNKLIINH